MTDQATPIDPAELRVADAAGFCLSDPQFQILCPACRTFVRAVPDVEGPIGDYVTGSNVTHVHLTLRLHVHDHDCQQMVEIHRELLAAFNDGML